jgi:hypothetical protein
MLGSSTPTASTANASPLWSVPFSSQTAVSPTVTPQGNVIANGTPFEELTPAGTEVWQVPSGAPDQPQTGGHTLTDALGNSYVGVQDQNGTKYLESFDSHGNSRWISAPLPSCCEIALGWDGHVYVTGRANPYAAYILGFDESTGAQTLTISTGDTVELFAYAGGLIQVTGTAVQYYSYNGQQTTSIDGGSPVGSEVGFSASLGANGEVFLAGYSSFNQFSCSAPSVVAIAPTGVKWAWTSPVTLGCGTFVTATPDGGAILTTQNGTSYTSISPSGASRWTYPLTVPNGGTIVFPQPAVVDALGNVALSFIYRYSTSTTPEAEGSEIDFVTQASSVVTRPSLVLEEDGTCDIDPFGGSSSVDLGSNIVYLSILGGCINAPTQSLQAFSEPGLSINYQLLVSVPGETVGPPPSCGNAALIGVRGSGDNNHPGYGQDYPGRHALAVANLLQTTLGLKLFDDDGHNDGVIGLKYPAVSVPQNLLQYNTSVAAGVSALDAELNHVASVCGTTFPTLIVGYSQGAQVVQNELDQLAVSPTESAIARSIAGVALLASPHFDPDDSSARGTFVADYPDHGIFGSSAIPSMFTGVTRSYCVANDPVCASDADSFTGTFVFFLNRTHQDAYNIDQQPGTSILNDAAGLLADGVSRRGGTDVTAVPSGTIAVYNLLEQPLGRRFSAAAVYSNGAPSVSFAWDFTGTGSYGQATTQPEVEHIYPTSSNLYLKKPPFTVNVKITFGDGSIKVYTTCVQLELSDKC